MIKQRAINKPYSDSTKKPKDKLSVDHLREIKIENQDKKTRWRIITSSVTYRDLNL